MQLLGLALFVLLAPATDLPKLLHRVAEEAERYRRMAPLAVAEETLRQQAGAGRVREVVSEYGVGELKASPGVVHEFRRVVSVDGRKIADPGKARHSLTLGLTSPDERVRKALLEDFARHGLAGAATDLGPLILLFTKRRVADYEFRLLGEATAGYVPVQAIGYRQTGGRQNITIFEGRRVIRRQLEGELLVRADGVPVRITLRTTRPDGGVTVVDAVRVDYVPHEQGFPAPVSAVHRQSAGSRTVVENRFSYTRFQVFKADAEIRFDVAEDKND